MTHRLPSLNYYLRRSNPLAGFVAALLLLYTTVAGAAVQVEISGVPNDLADNVAAYLALKKHAGDELSERAIRRLYAGAERSIRRALRPFGHYAPQIESTLVQTDDGWTATFAIDAGPRTVIEDVDIRVDGEGNADPAFAAILQAPGITIGDPLYHPDYDRLKARLIGAASERGYLDARITRHQLIVDTARHRARIVLHADSGPRYRLGSVRIIQDFLNERVIDRVVDLDEGDFYDGKRLRDTEFALYATGYFAAVDIDATPDHDARLVPLTISMTRTRRHRWTVGGGYSTDNGIYVKGGWYNRIVNRHGHGMGIDLRVSQVKQDILGRYVFPSGKPTDRLTVLAGLIREERGDTISNRFELGTIDAREWGRWQRDFFATAQAEQSELTDFKVNDIWIIPGMRFIRGDWDDITRPTRGFRVTTQLRGSSVIIGAPTDYLQLHVRSAMYVPFSEAWRIYLRGELGVTHADEFDVLPVSQRFFAGGDRSVRGFGLNELGPTDEQGNLVGGKHLLFLSAEVEYDFLKSWTLALFTDAGNALNEFDDPLEFSAGFGIRWRSPLGLIGADIAQPIGTSEFNPRLHFSVRPDL